MMLTNKEVYEITKAEVLGCFISDLQKKFIARILMAPNGKQNNILLFTWDRNVKRGQKSPNLFQ